MPETRLDKAPTGISGLDAITGGGLPRGRPTLVCGGPGCGKTLFALEFLTRGALQYGEAGAFISFEESAEDLAKNVHSLGFDLADLQARGLMYVDDVRVEASEIHQAGEYDFEGLFLRLGHAIDTVGATRVALDTIETLFGGWSNEQILRSELRRLFRWLKERGVTAVITGEKGEKSLTRQGLEEYISDCVIFLDHSVREHLSTRRLRVVKYRGSSHGTNEYPFLIDRDGISILPVTSALLEHRVSSERISSGIPALDEMLGGAGYYRGASILISGTAGTGKTSIAAHFVDAACGRGERCLYLAFEESEPQIARNMGSLGLDLERWSRRGLLRIHATRPSMYGLELHLATIHRLVEQINPGAVVIDPLSSFLLSGSGGETHSMLLRLIDFLKSRQITALMTNLTGPAGVLDSSRSQVSSLADTWILLRHVDTGGVMKKALYVLKSRGMAHADTLREVVMTPRGIELTGTTAAIARTA